MLEPGYDTDCWNYDLDYKYGNYNMRSDCLHTCYQKKMRQWCNQSDLFISFHSFRKEMLEWDRHSKLIYSSPNRCYENDLSADNVCYMECKYDCLSHSYDTRHQIVYESTQATVIVINPDDKMDTIVKHVPEVSFIQFFSNIGGLLGMWLGISLLQVFQYLRNVEFNAVFKRWQTRHSKTSPINKRSKRRAMASKRVRSGFSRNRPSRNLPSGNYI